ncbi:hypothetical protein OH708_08270 [Pseudomonas capsici]|uniref:hypothetical protein n=1 Tax=Pseudomonas capsici TaxID=2810614 RepID=UPI0021F248AE|nr:hypothetical protein [Pseudomonas capsici]MCV4287897.1 hypothetical protein [Pseudomonas capsici]
MSLCREQFESRYPVPEGVEWNPSDGRYQTVGGKYVAGLELHVYGVYVSAWGVWKASREDLVVELPDFFTYHDGSEITRAVIDADKLVVSLESAGLRVSL